MAKIIAIVGLSKNAGKTSYLNWFVKQVTGTISPVTCAVTTTGRDGEDIDLVTGDKKPKVILPPDVLFTSFEHIYNDQSSQIKALAKLPFRVIGKSLWLYQTLGHIEAEVVGPATRKEQEALIEIFERYLTPPLPSLTEGGKSVPRPQILIDGSLDRKSICLSEFITDIVLVIGASAGNLNEIKRQASLLKLYSQIPTICSGDVPIDTSRESIYSVSTITYTKNNQTTQTDLKSIYSNETAIIDILSIPPDFIYFPTSITETSYTKLKSHFLRYKGRTIFNHPLNINLPEHDLQALLKTNKLYTRIPFPLTTIAINSYSPYNEHIDVKTLKREIKKIFTDLPVIDITEIM